MLTSFYSKSEDVGYCGKLSGVRESGLWGERVGGGGRKGRLFCSAFTKVGIQDFENKNFGNFLLNANLFLL